MPHAQLTTLTPGPGNHRRPSPPTLRLPLDDLLAVTRAFLEPAVSRFGLDRWLRCYHALASFKVLLPPQEKSSVKSFKAYEPGFLRVDVKYWPAIGGKPRRYLFVVIAGIRGSGRKQGSFRYRRPISLRNTHPMIRF